MSPPQLPQLGVFCRTDYGRPWWKAASNSGIIIPSARPFGIRDRVNVGTWRPGSSPLRSPREVILSARGESMAGTYRILISTAACAAFLSAAPAIGQYAPVDPMPLGQSATSVMANKISGSIASGESTSNEVSSRCYMDAGPGPERRAMEAEYARRLGSIGKTGADKWRSHHGRAYRAKLIAAGKCPASAADGKRP